MRKYDIVDLTLTAEEREAIKGLNRHDRRAVLVKMRREAKANAKKLAAKALKVMKEEV